MVYISISKVWVGETPPTYCPNCKEEDCMEYYAKGGRGGVYRCKHCDTYVEWDSTKSDSERTDFVCDKCGEKWNLLSHPDQDTDRCPKCGNKVSRSKHSSRKGST